MSGAAPAPLVLAMWGGFVRWASKNSDVRNAFSAATNLRAPGGDRQPIDVMIDRATGHEEHVAHEFVVWVTATLWGEDEAPEALRDEIKARRATGRLPAYPPSPPAAARREAVSVRKGRRQIPLVPAGRAGKR